MSFQSESPIANDGLHRLGFLDLFRLSFRIFKTKPARTLLTIAGMAVGIGTVLFLISLGYGLQYILIGRLVATEDSLITLEAFYPSETNLNITTNDIETVRALPHVDEVVPVAEFTGEIRYGDLPAGFTPLIQIVRPAYFRLSGIAPDIGSAFKEGESGVVVSSQGLPLINLPAKETSLGKKIGLSAFYQGQEGTTTMSAGAFTQPLKIEGIISDDAQPPLVIAPSEFVSGTPPFFKRMLVKADSIETVEKVRDELTDKKFIISARIDLVNQARKVMNIITITLGVFGIAALVVSAIGMFNTMIVGFLERIYEVGIMKSLGATDKDVRNLFLMESSLIGLLGGIGGIAFGVGLGQAANFGLNLLAKYLGGKSFTLFITPLWFVALIIGLSLFIGLLAGFWPARRASHLSPKEAFMKR